MSQHPDSMEHKDPRILKLLRALESSLPAGSHRIMDYWDADSSAIGVAACDEPGRLVYISTHGQAEGTYAFECEAPTGDCSADYQVVDRGDGVGLDALLQKLRVHLLREPA